MSATVNTRGIVLFYEPWRDYDRRYVIYTEQFGKIRATAMGVRRPTAKLTGVLEPFAETELYIILGKNYKLGGATVQHRFSHVTKSLPKNAAMLYMVEVLDQLVKVDAPDERVYQLLFSSFTWLDHASYSKLLPLSFVIKLVHILGYTIGQDKVTQWLAVSPYEDIQKLRLDQPTWQALYQAVQLWLYEYIGTHVQSEKFLV
ncbi:MAG: DNA repair protein RecO [Patescibacteria group bacterium]|jgi:DNA repair protein RecO (recombination protein O)